MKKVKIKLSRPEITALYEYTVRVLERVPAIDLPGQLAKEIMWYTVFEMEKVLHNYEQKKFTLKWYGFQAVAFLATFERVDMDQAVYESVIVRNVINKISSSTLNNANL